MKILLKGLREGLGRLIIAGDYIFSPKKVLRDEVKQKEFDEKCQNLVLYQFYACPFCIKTRRNIRRLNLKIKTQNISSSVPSDERDELLKKGGKVQVPCLKIIKDDKVEWLYESDKIIAYLNNQFQ
ncbi:Glutaredoxin [hydrothermal vent metagenome]|uniref:Glutaredoxin n=1 Tax=hydrothermal vent metagenome TaxID=652676 RepID=A0A1W1CU08_9ZZZZ